MLDVLHSFKAKKVLAAPIPSATELATGSQAVNRSSVAALAFLVYDIMLTLDDEIALIWPKPRNLMKVNYFFIRYMPMLVQIPLLLVGSELTPRFHFSRHACFIWQVYQGVATISTTVAVDYILISRVYALYFDNRAIRAIVSLSFAFEVAVMSVGLALALPKIRFDSDCVVTDVPNSLILYAGASVLFQTLLFVFTVYKFLASLRSSWGRIPIIDLLMRDGTWAFIVLFVGLASDASLYALKNHAFAGVLYGWLLTAYSFCGYRILLNINHLTSPNTTAVISGSSIQFTSQFTSRLRETDASGADSYDLSPLSAATSSAASVPSGRGHDSDTRSIVYHPREAVLLSTSFSPRTATTPDHYA